MSPPHFPVRSGEGAAFPCASRRAAHSGKKMAFAWLLLHNLWKEAEHSCASLHRILTVKPPSWAHTLGPLGNISRAERSRPCSTWRHARASCGCAGDAPAGKGSHIRSRRGLGNSVSAVKEAQIYYLEECKTGVNLWKRKRLQRNVPFMESSVHACTHTHTCFWVQSSLH